MRLLFILIANFLCVLVFAQRMNPADFSQVNSKYDEINPVISPDGQTLFVTIGNHPQNAGGVRDPGDIWFSLWVDGSGWSAPIHAGPALNDRTFNTVAGFSADGQRLYLMNHYTDDGSTARTQGISVSTKTVSGWSKPENITIPFFRNISPFMSGYINPQENVLVYAAETVGTTGVEDIYVSLKDGSGQWSEPKNLGTGINTTFQEFSPSLSADGETLFFSTNGRGGVGSFDVFAARRLDGTWQNWSEPKNIGPGVNSEGRDLYYREYPAAGIALFTSTINSDGYGDVRMYRPEDLQQQISASSDTIQVTVQAPETTAASTSVTIKGKVRDAITGKVIQASLVFTSDDDRISAQGSEEGYSVELKPVSVYDVKIESPGYISTIEKVDLRNVTASEAEANFNLQPAVKGTTVTLKNVLFEQGTTKLLPESYPELDLVVDLMKTSPRLKIELAGHTESRGNEAMNLKLSQDRVDAVKEYLVDHGIKGRRISGKGYGSSRPIASNDTEESRRLNRRVEFTIKRD